MRPGVVLLALLLTTGLTGCTAVQDRWDDLQQDLEAEPRYQQAVLLEERQPFDPSGVLDPTNPPTNASDAGANWTTSFEVPTGTRTMQITFRVALTQLPEQTEPLPLPSQRGQIRVFVAPAGDGEVQDEFYEASGAGGFDFRRPAPGTWTLGFDQAIGQGNVTFHVEAQVPV